MRDFKPIFRKEKRIFFTLFFLHFFLQSYCQIEDPFHPVFENDGTPWYNSDLKRQEGFMKIMTVAKNTMSSYRLQDTEFQYLDQHLINLFYFKIITPNGLNSKPVLTKQKNIL